MLRVVEALQPRWVIGENVRGFVNEPLGLRRSLSDLESIRYQAVPFIIPACAFRPHRRDRVWIIARKNVADTRCQQSWPPRSRFGFESVTSREARQQTSAGNGFADGRQNVANPDHTRDRASEHGTVKNRSQTDQGQKEQPQPESSRLGQDGGSQRWATEPSVGRVADGVPNRAYRIKSLGNAVVPQIVTQIGKAIITAEQQ